MLKRSCVHLPVALVCDKLGSPEHVQPADLRFLGRSERICALNPGLWSWVGVPVGAGGEGGVGRALLPARVTGSGA